MPAASVQTWRAFPFLWVRKADYAAERHEITAGRRELALVRGLGGRAILFSLSLGAGFCAMGHGVESGLAPSGVDSGFWGK